MLKNAFKIVSACILAVVFITAEGVQEPAPSRSWVRTYVANNATTNGLMNWWSVTNYVMAALRANGVTNYAPEEDFTVDGDKLICHATATGNGASLTSRTFTVSRLPIVYSNLAARVVSSSLDYVPTGAVFTAFVSGGDRLRFRYFAATNLWLDLEHESHVDTNGTVSAILVATNATNRSPLQIRAGIVHSNAYTWVSFEQTSRAFREIRCTGFADGRPNLASIIGSFTVIPMRLSEGEWRIAAEKYRVAEGLQHLPSHACASGIGCAWADRYAPIVTNAWHLNIASDTTRSACNRPASLFELFVPMALAQYQEPPGPGFDITIPLVPNVPMVTFPPPDKDHFYVPDVWYAEEDWNNRENWITFPIRATIYYQSDDDGLWYPQTIAIKSFFQLDRLIPDLAVPPRPWDAPILCAKRDYCKEGLHVWKKCVCQKCGLVREHGNWEMAPGTCARCGNHDSTVRLEGGNEVPEDTDSICGEKCEIDDTTLHAGWHDGGGDENALYSCGCECGFYGADAVRINHTLIYTDPKSCEYKNGQVHAVEKTCSRCGAIRYLDEIHTPDPEQGYATAIATGDGEYDMVWHLRIGHCTDCDHDLEGLVEPHNPDAECNCSCGLTVHDIKEDGCGFMKCEKCGYMDTNDSHNQHGHVFGIYVDARQHRCICGSAMEDHHIIKERINGILQDYCDICRHAFGSGAKDPSSKRGHIEASGLLSRERGWSVFYANGKKLWKKGDEIRSAPPSNINSFTVNKRIGDSYAIDICERALDTQDLTSETTILDEVIVQTDSFYGKIGAVVLQWLNLDVEIRVTISCVIDAQGRAKVSKTWSFDNNSWLIN